MCHQVKLYIIYVLSWLLTTTYLLLILIKFKLTTVKFLRNDDNLMVVGRDHNSLEHVAICFLPLTSLNLSHSESACSFLTVVSKCVLTFAKKKKILVEIFLEEKWFISQCFYSEIKLIVKHLSHKNSTLNLVFILLCANEQVNSYINHVTSIFIT